MSVTSNIEYRIDQLGNYIDKLFKSQAVYHIVFWLVFYFFLIIINQRTFPLGYNMLFHLVSIIFYVIIVYINLLYLFPKYLTKNSVVLYIAVLSLSVVAITSVKIVALYPLAKEKLGLGHFFMANKNPVFLTTFFMAFASSIYNIINDWFVHQREKEDLQRQTLKSELRFLKSQINPHFLFNTLNSLYALTLKKSDQAPEIVLRLSEMMRYMLYECNEKQVLLSKEINYIENYLELEKIRHSGKCEIRFEVEGNLRNQTIAPLMFIPFIENSFKHGINTQLNKSFVHMGIKIDKSDLTLNIKNSKAPTLPSDSNRKSGGIGLVNVKRRLNLLYNEAYKLNIDDAPNEYSIQLQIELN